MGALACAVVDETAQLSRIRAEWWALLERSGQNQPTLTPLWLEAWWHVFGGATLAGGRKLRVVLFRDGDRLVGLAPLCARVHWYRPGLPFRRLELLATGEHEADETCSEYLGIVAEAGYEEPVAQAFIRTLTSGALGAWDELVLPAMNGEDRLPPLVTGALNHAGLPAESLTTSSCPYIALPASWDAYLKQLPSSRRYLVNRSLRDFEKWAAGEAELKTARTLAELEQGKRVLETLHGERWGHAGHAGVFRSSRFTAFHDAIMPALLERGALELSWLSVRGEPVAVLYNFVWSGKVYFYQSGRRVELPRGIRPGIVVHAYALKAAIAAGRREYDFLAGTAQYKRQLATATRPLVTVRATHARVREQARRLTEQALSHVRTLRKRFAAAPPAPKDGDDSDGKTDSD